MIFNIFFFFKFQFLDFPFRFLWQIIHNKYFMTNNLWQKNTHTIYINYKLLLLPEVLPLPPPSPPPPPRPIPGPLERKVGLVVVVVLVPSWTRSPRFHGQGRCRLRIYTQPITGHLPWSKPDFLWSVRDLTKQTLHNWWPHPRRVSSDETPQK